MGKVMMVTLVDYSQTACSYLGFVQSAIRFGFMDRGHFGCICIVLANVHVVEVGQCSVDVSAPSTSTCSHIGRDGNDHGREQVRDQWRYDQGNRCQQQSLCCQPLEI